MMNFVVEDMVCGGCVKSITKAIQAQDPQARVAADPATHRLEVESALPVSRIEQVLNEAGFTPRAA